MLFSEFCVYFTVFTLQAIKKELENEDYSEKSENSSLPISLMLQFLFHELRHSEGIKRWLYKKLSLEFDELLTKTTIGKFFDEVSVMKKLFSISHYLMCGLLIDT